MTATILLLLVLILLSGFFSGGEIALFSVPRMRAEALAGEGRRGARALERVKANPERLLITILIGNNLVNIGAASVATYAATQAFGSVGVGIAIGGMTLLVLFFGEIVPKSFAAANALRISLAIAPVFLWLARLLTPLVVPLEALTRTVLPQKRSALPGVTEAEIRSLTEIGYRTGEIDEHEHRIIERTFALDTTRAWEAMTPRVEIFAWPADRRLEEIAAELPALPYSRIPVYGESLDEITGILYVRDAYQALVAGQSGVTLEALSREPLFVPSTVTLSELLGVFRSRRIHLGVVVDEHGGTDGIISLEDVLEELVGEIVDELDMPEDEFTRVGSDTIVVDGGVDLREINQFFTTSFPVLEHRSLNGYLLEEFGRVPEPHETVEAQGVRIEVLRATETQVTRARITRLASSPGNEAAHAEPAPES
jgi:CBS domain containing-hemolysin-like protein